VFHLIVKRTGWLPAMIKIGCLLERTFLASYHAVPMGLLRWALYQKRGHVS